MAHITILAKGIHAAPYAHMLARSLTDVGRTCTVAEAPTGKESFCIVDADSVAQEVYERLLPDATLLYTAEPDSLEGVWVARTLVRPFSITSLLSMGLDT